MLKLRTTLRRIPSAPLLALLTFGPALRADDVTVFAAASLTDALTVIAGTYEQASGDKVVFNFGASSTLARQIDEGAPADLFFSADETKMDALEQKNRIVKASRRSLLGNQLVLVAATEDAAAIHSPADLEHPAVTRIALGDPKAVPIGVYAKAYLEGLGLWSNVSAKVVATENVRAALAAVEAGNANASFVYKTDAAISKQIKVVYEVPVTEGPKISYPIAIVQESAHTEAAQRFLDYLSSDASGRVFQQFGFSVP